MKTNQIQSCQKSELSRPLRRVIRLKSNLRKVVNYFNEDREKFLTVGLVVLFPVSLNVYLIVPDYYVPYYEQLDFLVFSLSESVGHILIASAWYLTIKDRVYLSLPISIILFSCYQMIAKIPFSESVPLHIELVSFILVFLPIFFLLWGIKRTIISKKVRKLNHGLLQHTNRLIGLTKIDISDDLLRSMLLSEATKAHDCAIEYFEIYNDKEEFDDFLIK